LKVILRPYYETIRGTKMFQKIFAIDVTFSSINPPPHRYN